MERYDTAIIGTGPAGLSAALTLKARNKNFILFGSSKLSEKVQKAHTVANYLGLPNISGADMQRTFLSQISDAGITITEEKVTLVFPVGDYFMLQAAGKNYEATTVIITTGMAPSKLLPGESDFLGRGVSYCATCDAALYRGKTAVIIGYSPDEESEAEFMREFASGVTYIPMYKGEPEFRPAGASGDKEISPIETIRTTPQAISGSMKANTLTTSDGEITADGFFILRESVAPSQLLPGLEMDGNHIAVKRDMSTSVAGCFAAGDVTGTPYQYIKAAGEGNVAALSAVSYIDKSAK